MAGATYKDKVRGGASIVVAGGAVVAVDCQLPYPSCPCKINNGPKSRVDESDVEFKHLPSNFVVATSNLHFAPFHTVQTQVVSTYNN